MNFSFQSVLNVALLLISRIAALRGVCRYLCNIAPYDGYDMFTRIYVLGREQPFVNVVPRAGDSNHSVESLFGSEKTSSHAPAILTCIYYS